MRAAARIGPDYWVGLKQRCRRLRWIDREEIEVKTNLAGMLALAAGLAAAPMASAHAQNAVKAGRWEFTSQLQTPAMPQLPPGASLPPGMQTQPGGGIGATHTSCIDPEKAVPTDPRPECKVDNMARNGGTITWSTTCTTQQGTVRSEGVAHYLGDTMEATMTTHLPAGDGRTIDNSQRITGRYLGPCAK
jgi:Protein of unknown function (DUF3617)